MKLKTFFYKVKRRMSFYWDHYIYIPCLQERRGKRLYKKILSKKSEKSTVIFTGTGMGDAFYAMAYLHEYRKLHPERKIVIIAPSFCSKIIESFKGGADMYIFLKKSKYNRYRAFFGSKELSEQGIKDGILHPCTPWFRADCQNPENLFQLRTHVFGLGNDATLQYHHFPAAATVACIPDFEKKHEKIVLINQDSNSCHLSKEEKEYFKKITAYLAQKGYTIYTNIVGEQQPVEGSIGLKCDLSEFLAIAQKVPLIVSVRSGILDLVVTTNINMFVFYSKNALWRTIYSIANWKCQGAYKEVCYDEIKDDTELTVFKNFAASIGLNV